MELRDLPSVNELLRAEPLARFPRVAAVCAARETLARARVAVASGDDTGDLVTQTVAAAEKHCAPRLRRAINATGVILHTNLGRAPLASSALERVVEVGRRYSNLEFDFDSGLRGSRHDHISRLVRQLTGAEEALVVNNNAAALLLMLSALAAEREVIISRGELIEIGGGFRIPDVLTFSGARLREIGTTNRTTADDYRRAMSPETGLLLRVHQSNFRTIGFTSRPTLHELSAVANAHELLLIDDLGSGSLLPLHDEPLVRDSLRDGADLVSFSGDKLLGGPQAGIVCGRATTIERLRRHPLQRALRPDKLTLAALEGTLLLYLDPERARHTVPALAMLHEPLPAVQKRAERLARLTGGTVTETSSRVGGGALPLLELPSAACLLEAKLAPALQQADPPILCTVRDDRASLDCRTLTDDEVNEVAAAVRAAREE